MPNSPRFVSGANQDNTLRTVTRDQQAPAYAATISPTITQEFTYIGPIALTGACTFNPSISQSYIGDEVVVHFTNGTAGALVVTLGANTGNAGTISVAIGKAATWTARFNGTVWSEQSRALTV
jgi:hypothetical protein